jgi:hypothetical protein
LKLASQIQKELQKMVDAGIIAPIRYSSWMSNLVVVRKKNGDIRLCVDFRNLNQLSLLKLLRQLRGGVNQLSLCLNNFKSINTFLIFLQMIINIIQHMDNKSNEHQSHIRYTQRQIFTRNTIKGENLFFFEMIGSLLSSIHHL